MILLDGKKLASEITQDLKLQTEKLGQKINLDIILVGDNPASLKYIDLKQKKAAEVGIGGKIYQSTPETLLDTISDLNTNPDTSAFFIQLPIPTIKDPTSVLTQISPSKDADGLNYNSQVLPAVVRGIITLLTHYQIFFNDKNIVVVNDSILIGQPLKKYFSQFTQNITLLNEQSGDLKPYTQKADILISATGVKNIITADIVKDSAVVVDVANGDVDFTNVSPKCSYITPTFGGIGPMTVISLMQNTLDLATKNI